MIKVDNNIVITLEDGTTISMTKVEAETLYSSLSAALNKIPIQPNQNNHWYTGIPNTITCSDSLARGYK